MDAQQLKLLAGRLRGLLEQHDVFVSHGQALDLVAALPGLRNWPEVQAFPERTASIELTDRNVGRLAHRLAEKHQLVIWPETLLAGLVPPIQSPSYRATKVWPEGGRPGVFVTDDPDAISALIARYEAAAGGAVFYAEQAGSRAESAIDLGDGGLWSSGLSKVPSGTLIVVGPIELSQQDWDPAAQRFQMACLRAMNDEHRVAVLFDTLQPDHLHRDAVVLATSSEEGLDDLQEALLGRVSKEGVLEEVAPFAPPARMPDKAVAVKPTHIWPATVEGLLKAAIAKRPYGLLAVGSDALTEGRAAWLEATLPLTDAAGPAAIVMTRFRGDYRIKELAGRFEGIPLMPSIESAYAHGYRRMLFISGYNIGDDMRPYLDDVLFIVGEHGQAVGDVFLAAADRHYEDPTYLDKVVAVVAISEVQGRKATHLVSDLYTPVQLPWSGGRQGELLDFLEANRAVRWEDAVEGMLATDDISMAKLRKEMRRHRALLDYLEKRRKSAPATV